MKRTRIKEKDETQILISEEQAFDMFYSDAYFTINKRLLNAMGPLPAILFSLLVDRYKFKKSRNELIRGGFEFKQRDIAHKLHCSKDTVSKYINKMRSVGIITMKRVQNGDNMIVIYIINISVLIRLLTALPVKNGKNRTTYPEIFRQGRQEISVLPPIIYNKHKNIKTKIYKKLWEDYKLEVPDGIKISKERMKYVLIWLRYKKEQKNFKYIQRSLLKNVLKTDMSDIQYKEAVLFSIECGYNGIFPPPRSRNSNIPVNRTGANNTTYVKDGVI